MSEPKFQRGDIVQHRNGGKYRIVGQGSHVNNCKLFYIYRSVVYDELWIRSVSEMEDGRFTLIFRPQAIEVEE
jgi:hypothetical protein